MTLAFAAPAAPPDSPLRRLDARWRLAAVVALSACAAATRTPAAAGLALVVALALVALARLSPARVLPQLAGLALAVAPLAVLLPLTAGGSVGWSPEAVPAALALAGRALAVGTLALVLLGTAPLPETLHAARALGVPAVLAHVLLMAWRYTFLLAEEWARLRTALRARGFRNRADAHSWRTIAGAAGGLLVRGADRAERVGQAMRCRGFDGSFRTLAAFRTGPAEVLALAAALLLGASLVVVDRVPAVWP